jgi:HEAT repeat protein
MKRTLILVCLALAGSGCGGVSTADLVRQMQAGDASQRLEVIRELGRRGEPAEEVVPALAEALKDGNAFVRRDAATTLGRLGAAARPAVPALLVARRDRERSVRRAADAALKQIDPAATRSRVGH